MEQVPVFSRGGIYLGHATAALFEEEPHDRTVERITRGLYCHQFGEPLAKDCPVENFIVDSGDPGWESCLRQALPLMQVRDVGGEDVFEYAFARAPERAESSLWLFRFYGRHVVMAATGRIAFNEALPLPL